MATSLDLINQAPEGTKLWILHLGNLEVDEAWVIRGSNSSTRSNPNPVNARRQMILTAYLIEHPTHGLILFETGAGNDYPEIVGPQVDDIFSRVGYDESMNLDAQIALTGHKIEDVKMVILGHLHLDHAGGLEFFKGTNVPVYAHELELKYAFYAVATKIDDAVYQAHYLTFDINWVPFHGSLFEIAPGLNLHHAPGHTPGLCMLQLNLKKSGTWIFTSDMYHVKENYQRGIPQGHLARDYEAWIKSHQLTKGLVNRTGAKVILGHCWDTMKELKIQFAPNGYE